MNLPRITARAATARSLRSAGVSYSLAKALSLIVFRYKGRRR